MHKISLEDYESLYDPEITKSNYDAIIGKIENRFGYIMKTICTKLSWFDYDNGWENNNGYFNPNEYHSGPDSYITFQGDYKLPPPYNTCPDIPIRWLWEDFEEEFRKEVNEFKEKESRRKQEMREKRIAAKEKRASIKSIIQSKLTKEELKFIKFK